MDTRINKRTTGRDQTQRRQGAKKGNGIFLTFSSREEKVSKEKRGIPRYQVIRGDSPVFEVLFDARSSATFPTSQLVRRTWNIDKRDEGDGNGREKKFCSSCSSLLSIFLCAFASLREIGLRVLFFQIPESANSRSGRAVEDGGFRKPSPTLQCRFGYAAVLFAVCVVLCLAPGAWACEDPPVQVILTVVAGQHGTIKVVKSGQTICDPCGGSYAFVPDTTVELTATPDSNYTFLIWAPPPLGKPVVDPWLSEEATVSLYLEENARMEAYFYDDPKFPDKKLEAAVRKTLGIPSESLEIGTLANVTSLLAVDYDIVDLHGLEYCTGLELVCLNGNQIENLGAAVFGDDWGLIGNPGLGPGHSIYLTGNPLQPWAVCWEVPILETRGVTVYGVEACDTDPESEGDQDQDGFTNAEEMQYLRYYHNDPTLGMDPGDLFHFYLAVDGQPGISHQCFEELETVEVTVEVSGEGQVYLGDGYATEGNPKTWEFAKWEEGCPTLCSGGGTWPECSFNQITLVAEADTNWAFRRWWDGDGDPASSPSEAVCHDRRGITAEFVYRPGLSDLDLVGDLGEFLVTIGVYTTAAEVYELDFDRGDFEIDGNGNRTYTGNGIPAAAEFGLLEAVLKDATLDLTAVGGVSHMTTWEDFTVNLDQAAADVPAASGAVIHAIAAYMTLGTYAHRKMAEAVVEAEYSVDLDTSVYANVSSRYYSPAGDADNDGETNAAEWADRDAQGGTGAE